MSARINIAELRAIFDYRDLQPEDRGRIYAALPALLDLAEAAHTFEPQPDRWSNGDQRQQLRAALAHFDFGDAA